MSTARKVCKLDILAVFQGRFQLGVGKSLVTEDCFEKIHSCYLHFKCVVSRTFLSLSPQDKQFKRRTSGQ